MNDENKAEIIAEPTSNKKGVQKMAKQVKELPTFREVPTPNGDTVKISFSKLTAGNLTKQLSGEGHNLLEQPAIAFFHALKEQQPNIKRRDSDFIYESIEDKDKLDTEVMRLFADAIEDSRKGGTVKLNWD